MEAPRRPSPVGRGCGSRPCMLVRSAAMIGREVLSTAMPRFRTHPMQTWLTLAGLIVGTAAIIIVVSLGLSGRAFLMSPIQAVPTHLVRATYDGHVNPRVSHTVDDPSHAVDDQDVAAHTHRIYR